jgi:LmbE family N-acetylglucosaminyl deacetylase
MADTIAVFVAHPDDEVLGCGGSIAKWSDAGNKVHVIILAEGTTSRDPKRDRELRAKELSGLAQAAETAGSILGVESIQISDFPDNRMDSIDRLDVIKDIEKQILRLKPNIVVTHHSGDVNIDHRIIHEAVVTACRPQPKNTVKCLMAFEVVSSTEWQTPGSAPAFQPNWFEDISTVFDRKLKALEAYDSELRPWPHSRSVKAVEQLARWRGASVGIEAAEAFMLLRNIVK